MRDDEIDDAQQPDHPVTAMLERLDSDDDFDAGDEVDQLPAISRREVDALVDLIVDEELKRLDGRKG